MPLTISLATKPKKNISFVFFLFDDAVIERDHLFQFLGKEEQAYLNGIVPKLSLKENESRVLIAPGAGMRKIIVIGMGNHKDSTHWKAGLATRIAVQLARKEKIGTLAFSVDSETTSQATIELGEVIATNAIMANFEFVKYKTKPKDAFKGLATIEWIVKTPIDAAIKEGLRRGMIIGEETNACRDLANTPGGDMTPVLLAKHAVMQAKKVGIRATVFDEKKMASLGMGGVLAVGKGSDVPPRFIILEYMKGPKSQKPVVLVGKGITFDSGGLNLKPSDHIYEMHMDMSGGAAVIHTIIAAARLKLKKNIVALVPVAENMVSGKSYRPGDLIRTMNGIMIEILNTDAEGRVVLADALEYSKRYSPSLVIDVATLTGAAMAALGLRYSAMFTSEKKIEETFRTIGDAVGDAVWPLPMSAAYEDDIKSTFGDWANAGRTRYGGATTAAVFLWQFIKGYPWVHLDIAPRMTSIEEDHLAPGAAGAPIRLLTRFFEDAA